MKIRKDVRDLSPTERTQLVDAFLAMKAGTLPAAQSRIPAAATVVTTAGGTPNRYDDYVWLHNQVGSGAHHRPGFCAWHREFLRQFEYDLQQVSGNSNMTLPYWDWTTARASGDPGYPFEDDFLGGMGTAGTGPTDPNAWIVTTGAFSTVAAWRINIPTSSGVVAGARLQRRRALVSGLNLPTRSGSATTNAVLPVFTRPAYDASPYADAYTGAPPNTDLDASFRKYLEYLLHDGTHVWIGGWYDDTGTSQRPDRSGHMTIPAVAVNDPVFWLHHNNIDRLWAIWQQKNPLVTHYLPPSGAPSGHNSPDTMVLFDDPSRYNAPLHATPTSTIDWKAGSAWFVTDLPEFTAPTTTVDIGNVPEGRTTYVPLRFSIRTPQPVTLRITGVTSGPFSVPVDQGMQQTFTPNGDDPMQVVMYVQYIAPAAGPMQTASVTVEGSITDRDGYFASTVNGTYHESTWAWTFTVSATPIARPRTAVALVLDRSGSMADSAGPLGTKADLLESAVISVRDILRSTDGVALVTFDDIIDTVSGVVAMGRGSSGPGRTALQNATTSGALDPRGSTAIGNGMIRGAQVLDVERTTSGTPYSSWAMVVLTDGNENVTPYTTMPAVTTAIAPYSSRVFAIGLGTEDNVSTGTLGAIANYQLITGEIASWAQRFKLTKYFVQILADATRTSIVTDPEGSLHIGEEHAIPFVITESDVDADVVVLCPAAPLLDVRLVAPDGSVYPMGAPNTEWVRGVPDTVVRFPLPLVPSSASGTHAGTWKVVLALKPDRIKELFTHMRKQPSLAAGLADLQSLPYSVIARAESNLELTASVLASSHLPGAKVEVQAQLHEYGVPLGGARCRVEVTRPDGSLVTIALTETETGRHSGSFVASSNGVWTCRIVAEGATRRGSRFSRETTRTVPINPRIDVITEQTRPGSTPDDSHEALCHVLRCLLAQHGVHKLLEKQGIDVEALAKCLRGLCTPKHEHPRPVVARDVREQMIATMLALGAASGGFSPPPPTRPVPPPKAPEGHVGDHPFGAFLRTEGCDCACLVIGGDAHDEGGGHDHGDTHDHGDAHDHGGGQSKTPPKRPPKR